MLSNVRWIESVRVYEYSPSWFVDSHQSYEVKLPSCLGSRNMLAWSFKKRIQSTQLSINLRIPNQTKFPGVCMMSIWTRGGGLKR